MILTAMQPTYLPWCGLFDRIAQGQGHVIFDVVPMDSSSQTSYENRNKILTSSGPLWLTVPVHKDRETSLCKVRIVENTGWRRKHWRSIEQAYHRAPFWSLYAPELEEFYPLDWHLLVDLNAEMLRWFLRNLGLGQPVHRASTLGLQGTKSELVLDMCKRLGAHEYIFGKHGRGYADVAAFEAAGVTVRFQEYQHPTYPQVGSRNGFESHLSVLDLLMNVGPDSLKVITGGR